MYNKISDYSSFQEVIDYAIAQGASDIHFRPNAKPYIRQNTALRAVEKYWFSQDEILKFAQSFLNERKQEEFSLTGGVDSAFSYGNRRFRANVYSQKDGPTIALRIIPIDIPTIEELQLPLVLKDLCEKKRGLILITGPTGSGKSTTLASMIDYINQTQTRNIITIEDPIEYLHEQKNSLISQRELGSHTESFASALRSSLRQDPDIILVGEMRDFETISVALTAAETGHVVLSTLHTIGASKSMDRIIDVFPAHQQPQVRSQLSGVLEAVISQQLVPITSKRGMRAAVEVTIGTPAIRNVIREGKTHQIQSVIESSAQHHMITMDRSLIELYRKGNISREIALQYSVDKATMMKELEGRY